MRAADSESTQEYTPFEGFDLTAKVTDTFVRGRTTCWTPARLMDRRVGRYLSRPAWNSPPEPGGRNRAAGTRPRQPRDPVT